MWRDGSEMRVGRRREEQKEKKWRNGCKITKNDKEDSRSRGRQEERRRIRSITRNGQIIIKILNEDEKRR